MADGIVTELRGWFYKWDWTLPDKAANEIESLRAKLALTEQELFRVAHERSELADAYRQLRQEYEKVRGNA